jgi:hypothetical protein
LRNRIETRIQAPREAVWQLISDFTTYPDWNPFTPQVLGQCAAGEYVKVFVQLKGKPFWMPREVTKAEPNRHFEWEGRAWYSFLAPGQRKLMLEDLPDGGTLLIDDEYVGGISVVMPAEMREVLRSQMVAFGAGLKAAAERLPKPKSAA